MNNEFKDDHSNNIDNYADLMQEYLEHISPKDYLNRINYEQPITTIEPLAPISNQKYNYNNSPSKGKKVLSNSNDLHSYYQSIEQEKERERKKKIEYQQYLAQQIEEKKNRKTKEKEDQLKEELMYEQRVIQEMAQEKEKSSIGNEKKQLAEELFLEHPKVKEIMQRNQLTSIIEEPITRAPVIPQSTVQHQIQQVLPQHQPNNDINTASMMMSTHQQMPSYSSNPYMNQYNIPPGTNTSMPILNINQPLSNLSNQQLYSSNNNLVITNQRDNYHQIPMSPSQNIIQRGAMNGTNLQYPPILEKMLDYFFQEQVKIIKDYKETIEQLKNERDQALYLNKANDERMQALEKLKSDQAQFTTHYGFNPYQNNYERRVEDTLASIIEQDFPPCHFKSKYEDNEIDLNDEPILTEVEGKCSMRGETKFVKQTGERNLIETWIKEDNEQIEDNHLQYKPARDIDEDNKAKLQIDNANDISAITKRNLCDDKSFDPELQALNKNEGSIIDRDKEKENDQERGNNSISETNENICFPEFYREEEDESEIVTKLSGEVMMNKDNNVRQIDSNSNQQIVNINHSEYEQTIWPNGNRLHNKSFKETVRYCYDNANEKDDSNDNMELDPQFRIETSEINNNEEIDNNPHISSKTEQRERNDSSSSEDRKRRNVGRNEEEMNIKEHNSISIANNTSRHITYPNQDKDKDSTNVVTKPKDDIIHSNLHTEANIDSKRKSKPNPRVKGKEPSSPFNPMTKKEYYPTEVEDPKLSDINPVTSSNCNSDFFKQKESKSNNSHEGESSKDNGNVLQNKMTYFEENSSLYDQESSIVKSSKHVTGIISTAKTNPLIRVPPREATKKNISNMNSFYEKIKQKKKERQSTESSKVEEGNLLDESLNTFNTNLRDETMNEKMIQKVEKYTKVALNQIGQSQLSIFEKPFI